MNLQTRSRLVLAVFFLTLANGLAFQTSNRDALPNFDRRFVGTQTNQTTLINQLAAEERLKVRLPQARVELDRISGAPKFISAGDQFLSGPHGQGKAISVAVAARFAANDPYRPTKAFLQEHRELFGHGPEALDKARIKNEFVTPHSGLRTVVWEQQVDDIPLFESVFISHTTRDGELVNVASQFLPDPEKAANRSVPNRAALMSSPTISARQAVVIAARNVGLDIDQSAVVPVEQINAAATPEKRQFFKSISFKGKADAKLIWLPMSQDRLQLCWDVILMSRARGEMFRVLVDVQTGEPLLRHCLTDYISDATYRVYTSDSPSPFSPSYSTPVTTQPPLTNRVLLTLPALDTNASPNGWIDDGGNETLGNNVDAHTDVNADNVADLPRPHGSPARVFDFPLDLSQSPSTYTNAAVVQLFYWNNFMHDKLYQLGFTEAAGNFQSNNFGKGGAGNDAVQADAQDGSGVNNANFSTPPDGSPGRMQMYIFNGSTPNRDGDLDAEVVLHEYTHGLSNRRVGGGVGISALQTGGMGEGWSDFYAMALLSEPGDDVNGVYAYGGYVTYGLSGLTQNYYFGIRRYPYCTDMNKNPLTFKDIDPAQASAHTGIPRSPIIGSTANEVHNMGEVWCVTLREARASLINKYGWAVGNQLMLQIVTDGMNLSPANPNFLQARDAILQADLVDNGGANRNELWAAFAKRGMGYSATSPASSTTTGVLEAFDVPDNLVVTPSIGLTSTGQIGGTFTPTNQIYGLTNNGANLLNWTAWTTQPWVAVSSASGSLPIGAADSVNVFLTSAANSLANGSYFATVIFSNATTGVSQTRAVNLTVSPPRVLFYSLDADPGWTRTSPWAFGKPSGLGGTSHGRPDPTAGATGTNVFGINLTGDYSTAIGGPYYLTTGPLNFTGYTGMKLKFQRWLNADYPPYVYETIDISTNGTTWISVWANSSNVEIADATWTNVSYDISAYADNQSNVFIRWGHRVGSTGAFAYSGWNLDDVEFLGAPVQKLTLTIPSSATEGDGVVTGTVTASSAPSNDLIVSLNSSDTTEATVPATVTILAGQSSAVFNLNIVDDAELDGTQTATVTATAASYTTGTANISVLDNETATLSVILPATATEGQGTVIGTVQSSAAPSANVVVSLSSSDTSEIQVPASIIIPAGQTSAVFTATVVDDNQIDGSQSATVIAHVQNWTDGTNSIVVLDNESTNLTVILPVSALENTNVLATAGSVKISGTRETDLLVSLASDTPARLTVPPTVTIFAGQVSNTFSLTLLDNSIHDGDQIVSVIATASAFVSGTNSMTVLDDDISPAIVTQPTNQTTFAGGVAVFGVGSLGKPPLNYQWQFNGTNLLDATNAMLTLTNVQFSQAGSYAVQIANAYGSVASSSAVLTVYAHHFTWDIIPSPQTAKVPFAVTLAAKDVADGTITNFTGTVSLNALATNRAGINMDFEAGSLAPWLPLNLGNQPGPYQLVTFDVNGDGTSSTAFRIAANSGTPDGITQNVSLTAGVTYSVKMDIATDDTTSGNNADGGTTAILIGGVTVAQYSWGSVTIGNIYRTNLSGTFTPATNGIYAVTLTFYRAYFEPSSLWNLADDLRIIGPGSSINISPTVAASFTNGVWNGNITALTAGTNVILVANDNHGHIGQSNPFNATNPAPPVIITQPAGQIVLGGSNVTISVVASGTAPLNYFWRKNASPLTDVSNSTLILLNVSRANSGTYNVIITNIAGSVTSSNAILLVHVPQRLGAPQLLADGTLAFASSDADGGIISPSDLVNLQAQASTNLVDWVNLPGALTVTNGGLQLFDFNSTNAPMRFYRIMENW